MVLCFLGTAAFFPRDNSPPAGSGVPPLQLEVAAEVEQVQEREGGLPESGTELEGHGWEHIMAIASRGEISSPSGKKKKKFVFFLNKVP